MPQPETSEEYLERFNRNQGVEGGDENCADWCEHCNAPPFSELPLWERLLSGVCYRLVLLWPVRWLVSHPCRAMLPWAGNFGFRCHCRRAA